MNHLEISFLKQKIHGTGHYSIFFYCEMFSCSFTVFTALPNTCNQLDKAKCLCFLYSTSKTTGPPLVRLDIEDVFTDFFIDLSLLQFTNAFSFIYGEWTKSILGLTERQSIQVTVNHCRLCMNTTIRQEPGVGSRTGVIPKLSANSSQQYLGSNQSLTGSAGTDHRSGVKERLRPQIIQKSTLW